MFLNWLGFRFGMTIQRWMIDLQYNMMEMPVPRGTVRAIGDRFKNKNGYTYEKTENGWEPVHQLIAEKRLGRPLKPEERAAFKDNDRTNLADDNIIIVPKYSKQSARAKLIRTEEQIRELQEQAQELREQIAKS
jgi:hypothetical protein